MADSTEPAPAAADAPAPEAAAVEEEKQMKCINLTGFGGIRNVKVQSKAEVKPAEGEVLIRVKAW